jgi:drug/metabolite transporter (DMT)-like permease
LATAPDPSGSPLGTAARGKHVAAGNGFAIVSMMTWAAGFPAAEILLDTWPPLTLITARFVLAVGLLIPIWMMLDGRAAVFGARWRHGTVMGGLCFGIAAYLLLLAQDYTDPVTVALIASAAPIAAAIIELVTGQRRLRRTFVYGVLASVIGGIVATGGGLSVEFGLGAVLAVRSCFLFAWGSFASVRDFPELSPVGRSTITLAGGCVMTSLLLIASHLAGFDMAPARPMDGNQLGLLMIYAIASMALSQVMFIASVGRLGIAIASFHMNTAPFYVMLILLALGAPWSWPQALGALIVAFGVILSQRD